MQSLVDILRKRAERPDARDFTFFDGSSEQTMSYAELHGAAQALAAYLLALGSERGARVLCLLPPGLEFVRGFFGCMYAGLVAVPLPASSARVIERTAGQIANVARDCGAALVLTTPGLAPTVRSALAAEHGMSSVMVAAIDDPGASASASVGLLNPTGGLAFLQYTSGSTGAPKGVMVSHDNLLDNSERIRQSFGHTQADRGVIWLPPHHDMGLIGGILQPIYVGFPVYLMDPKCFVTRPFRWLSAVAHQRATVSGGPNFAFEQALRLAPEEVAQLDLSTWRVAFTGAEPVSPSVMELFEAKFGPVGFRRGALRPVYGLAEATLLVSCGDPGIPVRIHTYDAAALERGRAVQLAGDGGRRLVACGQPRCEVQIVHPETRVPCAEGEVGEIWVRSPSVAAGYFGKPELSREVFEAALSVGADEERYLRTGDLGFIDGGELTITGRLKDIIIIRGRNLSAEDLEASVLAARRDLVAAAAVSLERNGHERLCIVAELAARSGQHPAEVAVDVARAIAREYEVPVDQVLVVKPRTLPRTASGKLRRGATRAALMAESLQPLGATSLSSLSSAEPQTAMEHELLEVWQEVFRRPLGVHDNFFDLGGDSVAGARVQARATEAGLEVALHDIFDNPTVALLAPHVRRRSEAQVAPNTARVEPLSEEQMQSVLRELEAGRSAS